jgi:hypothetical protein
MQVQAPVSGGARTFVASEMRGMRYTQFLETTMLATLSEGATGRRAGSCTLGWMHFGGTVLKEGAGAQWLCRKARALRFVLAHTSSDCRWRDAKVTLIPLVTFWCDMPLLPSGQPFQGIMQLAYVVKDIRESIHEWAANLNVGPWFLGEHFIGINPMYRGRPVDADIAIAHSFAGHVNIELIQPNDDKPSVYKEVIESRGYGFHHWGIATADVDADIKRYETAGLQVAFRLEIPGGGKIAFLDSRGALPGFIELIEVGPEAERGMSRLYAATVGWDGSNAVRSL